MSDSTREQSAGIEGTIDLDLHWDGRIAHGVAVRSTRPLTASRLLLGRSSEAAQAMVPLMFSICGRAQSLAAAQAIEAACGVAAEGPVALQRELILAAEMIQEYLWRVLLDLPVLVGEPPLTARFVALRRDIQMALPGGGLSAAWWHADAGAADLERWQQVSARLNELLQEDVLGMTAAAWLDLEPCTGIERWRLAGTTSAARALARFWPSALGRSQVALLPQCSAQEWARELGQRIAADGAFAAAPTWRGAPAETGALARTSELGPVAQALRETGKTVGLRLLARLTELALLAGRLSRLVRGEVGERWSEGAAVSPGAGLGRAETARGILLHFVQLDAEGMVVNYRIVAPTEWNFHPQGALVQGLAGFAAVSADEVRRAAALMAHALDPCVACRIEVRDA